MFCILAFLHVFSPFSSFYVFPRTSIQLHPLSMAHHCLHCVGCIRLLLLALSIIFLLAGFSIACLMLWFRYDAHVETQLRQLVFPTTLSNGSVQQSGNNSTSTPPELIQPKATFRQIILTAFWLLIAIGLSLCVLGFLTICAACTRNIHVNGLVCVLLVLHILLQLLMFLVIALDRNVIFDQLDHYVSISMQYNFTDADILRNRFACCGDGIAQASYNYECTGLGLPNCRQMLQNWLGTRIAAVGICMAALIVLEVFATISCSVLICTGKNSSLVNIIH